jgi:hypothetical protein
MKTRWMLVAALAAAACGGPAARGADDKPYKPTGTKQSSQLYTAPDPSAAGGLRGVVKAPKQPLTAVFALDADNSAKLYQGTILPDGHTFEFKGLPVAKYDLFVLFPNEFFEGITLTRDEDTLEKKDRDFIEGTVMRSSPFFNEKKIHRIAGTTGREGKAGIVLQELRSRPVTLQDASVRSDIQIRSLKKGFFEDVGAVGWHLTLSREIVRQEVGGAMPKGLILGNHVPSLGRLRVIDAVKDLGELDLCRPDKPGAARGSR